ncbi:hypothetical protein SAMN06265222_110172 [Neorhodopirellula lusitana]|uniref:Secreted protein n=1 Tax=Neorhodopirellula lusitana TaxID=445327 RepID=A0ABY1QD61_9BACT|nr:hypothetical protein [Neorhodopirellula lusitana]SMP67421.1 hypothetical protein SAMN06265222_110172 [Neorhodopirellula lusitana]
MMQTLATLLVVLASLVFSESVAASDPIPPVFSITTKRESDKVDVFVQDNTTVISIRSPFGISNAVVERRREKWPERVTLHVHLKGLENFQIANGKVTLEAAVSGYGEQMRVRLWKDKNEDAPLDPKNQYWMEIRRIDGKRNPVQAGSLKEGYFEMKLPKQLLEDNSKSITISWIDFYRG